MGHVPACQDCFSLALGGACQRRCGRPAWQGGHGRVRFGLLSPLLTPGMPRILSALLTENKEKVLPPFAHAVFCNVVFVRYS